MLILTLSAVLIQASGPGQSTVKNLPENAEVYAESDSCEILVKGTELTGEAGCAFRLAIVMEDGSVSRLSGRLGAGEDPEDIPRATSATQTDPSPTIDSESPPPRAPAGRMSPKPTAGSSLQKTTVPWPVSLGARAGVTRSVDDFGFVGFTLAVGAFYGENFYLGGSWHRALGRAATDLLTTKARIEEELDLLLVHLRYLHPFTPHLAAYIDGAVGPGRLTSREEADERHRIGPTTQAFIAYRPAVGLRWQTGALQLSIGWQLTFAEGQWYPADAFGSADSDEPPDQSGLLSQGLELSVGFAL